MVRYEAIDDDSPPPTEESSKNYKIKVVDVSSSFPQLEVSNFHNCKGVVSAISTLVSYK